MDVSDLLAITLKKNWNKGSQMEYTKKIFKKKYIYIYVWSCCGYCYHFLDNVISFLLSQSAHIKAGSTVTQYLAYICSIFLGAFQDEKISQTKCPKPKKLNYI